MGRNKSKLEVFREKIYNNLFWILLIVGIAVIYISSWDTFNVYVQGILEKIGLSVLSSGVFASVLKSIQFTGLFKKEIEKIVLGTKFIENRNDLPQLWKKVSKSVYDKKFPSISDELDDLILDFYLPIKHKYYYEDFRYTLKIDELTDDNIIKFTQSFYFKVILAEGETEAKLESVFAIDKSPEIGNLINERIYYKIDGVDILSEITPETTEDEFEKKIKLVTIVQNKKEFLVETSERREYCIKEDNFKLLRVSAITKEMDVSITYPENMSVSFFNIGLVNKFERKHVEHTRTISRVHKKGLVLPYQGFGIAFGIK